MFRFYSVFLCRKCSKKLKYKHHIMNKIVINSILAILTIGLCYACYVSIYSDIAFDEE